ncbi:MAG: helicase-associated domain-containing protein [Candidatus Promineifilaceae bacterium]
MRSLEQALYDHELITLRVIGEWWEMDLAGMEKGEAVAYLAQNLAALDMQQEVRFLPPEELSAMNELIARGGRVPVAAFSRSHGEVRQMGPGRMEREEPWLDPVSPLEALWYRGFLYRAFQETAEGMVEFFYLPEELLGQFPEAFNDETEEPQHALVPVDMPDDARAGGDTRAVDDLTTLLAVALRMAVDENQERPWNRWLLDPDPDRYSLLLNLARDKGWLRESEGSLRPTRSAAAWLKAGREAQLYELADAWSNSTWNDLCHTPGLICEGVNWQNDPILARTALLDLLPRNDRWYSLEALVALMYESNPDFQRPDGNYDTWYIRDQRSDGYLAGFDNWHYVEGRLLRFLLLGPMNWLGLAVVTGNPGDARFRLSDLGLRWLAGDKPADLEDKPPIVVHPDASILVAHNADRYQRFQVTRVAELESVDGRKPYHYRLTPASLSLAGEQGITAERLIRFLTTAAETELPKSVQRAIERWSQQGVEARLESVQVLRAADPAILETLRANAKTRDLLGESLGDLAVVVKPGQWPKLRAACAQLGLFIDDAI